MIRHPILMRSLLPALLAFVVPAPADVQDAWPEWTVESTLRIGDLDDPAYAFDLVGGFAVAADGTIFTAHPRESLIRRWASNGAAAGRIGGPGQGPGEFEALGEIGVLGDSLWAMDTRASRVTWFGLGGDVLRTSTLTIDTRAQTDDPSLGRPRSSEALADGTYFGGQAGVLPQLADRASTPILMLHLDDRMRILDTVWVHRHLPRHTAAARDPSGQWLMAGQPFGDNPLTSFDAARETLVVLEREVDDPARPAELSVLLLAIDGDTLFHRPVVYQPVPLSRATVDRVIEATADRWARSPPDTAGSAADDDRYRRLAEEALFAPAYHPAATDVILGRDGTIWIRTGGPPEAGLATWLVLDEGGEPLARARLPSSLAVRLADRDHVWGTELDEAGVPYVVRLTLGR